MPAHSELLRPRSGSVGRPAPASAGQLRGVSSGFSNKNFPNYQSSLIFSGLESYMPWNNARTGGSNKPAAALPISSSLRAFVRAEHRGFVHHSPTYDLT